MPRDAIVGAVILAAAGIYWHAAGTIRHSSLDDSVGAAGVPNALAVALACLALLLILRAFVLSARQAPRTVEAADEARPDDAPRAHFRALGMLMLGVLYLLIVPVLGYAVSIAVLLAAVALYNYRKPTLELALFAVLGSAAFYLLFVRILGIPLPAGIWPSILPV
jgi:putative tricarboxylic transport membrane protein